MKVGDCANVYEHEETQFQVGMAWESRDECNKFVAHGIRRIAIIRIKSIKENKQ